nr:MAG TPA: RECOMBINATION ENDONUCLEASE VII [Caudoviricetes sp.]
MNNAIKRKQLSKQERLQVYEKCNGHCAYCGCELPLKDMQVDHIIPLALINDDKSETFLNYLPACRSCNHYKSAMSLETFRCMIERMPDVLMRDSVTYKNAVRFGLVIPTPHKVEFYFEKLGIEVNK